MKNKLNRIAIVIGSIIVSSAIVIGVGLQNSQSMTVRGIPVFILVQGLTDEEALNQYLSGDKKGFHDRLEEIGIKDEIKAFYRPKIHDEGELDRYIHQIFYNLSGYVGVSYTVNSQGILVLKGAQNAEFKNWYKLATAAGIAAHSELENGVYYVTTPQGARITYQEYAKLFPASELEKIINSAP